MDRSASILVTLEFDALLRAGTSFDATAARMLGVSCVCVCTLNLFFCDVEADSVLEAAYYRLLMVLWDSWGWKSSTEFGKLVIYLFTFCMNQVLFV